MPRLIATVLILLWSAMAQAASPPKLSEASGTYSLSQRGSNIRFAIGQIDGGGLQGRFTTFSGTIRIDGSDISQSRVDLIIIPASVTTGKERVDNFLRSNAVFDADNEKRIVFRSTGIKRSGDDGATVVGRLTARGKTSNETFTVRLEDHAAGRLIFHVTGKIFRSKYGMDVGTPIYSNVVDFDMRFEAKRK